MAVVLVNTADFNANTPATGDSVIVQDTTPVDVVTNVDQKGDYYAALEAVRGFQHALGQSGGPVRCNAAKLILKHAGDAWITSDDNNGAGGQAVDDWLVDLETASNTAYLASSPNAMHADSVWHRGGVRMGIAVSEGSMEFGANARISIFGSGGTLKLQAEDASPGNALPRLIATGGNIISDKTITDAQIENCTMRQDTKPITYLTIGPGGRMAYWHTAATVIEVLSGGHLDLGPRKAGRAIPTIIVRKGGMIEGYDVSQYTGTHELIDENRR